MRCSHFWALLSLSLMSGAEILSIQAHSNRAKCSQRPSSFLRAFPSSLPPSQKRKKIFFRDQQHTPVKVGILTPPKGVLAPVRIAPQPVIQKKLIRTFNRRTQSSFTPLRTVALSAWGLVKSEVEKKANEFAWEQLSLFKYRKITARQREVLFCIFKEAFSSSANFLIVKKVLTKAKRTPQEEAFLRDLRQTYGACNNTDLLQILTPNLLSLTVAQCRAESSWGQAGKKNSLFGLSCRGRISTYQSPRDSIRDYFSLLNKGRHFRKFRTVRHQVFTQKSPQAYAVLSKTLTIYCPVGNYPAKISRMIKNNHFDTLDTALEKKLYQCFQY